MLSAHDQKRLGPFPHKRSAVSATLLTVRRYCGDCALCRQQTTHVSVRVNALVCLSKTHRYYGKQVTRSESSDDAAHFV